MKSGTSGRFLWLCVYLQIVGRKRMEVCICWKFSQLCPENKLWPFEFSKSDITLTNISLALKQDLQFFFVLLRPYLASPCWGFTCCRDLLSLFLVPPLLGVGWVVTTAHLWHHSRNYHIVNHGACFSSSPKKSSAEHGSDTVLKSLWWCSNGKSAKQ